MINSVFSPIDLLCEYARDPLGVNTLNPRLSWTVQHEGRGQYQTAYRIIAASRKEYLNAGTADLWDTGKVKGSNSINIEYKGKTLLSMQICYWKVQVWDKEGKASSFSKPAHFETGLLEDDDWKAQWIRFPMQDHDCSPIFRKVINLDKEFSRARAYISGLGYYELRINGQKVGNHVLDPGWTDYNKRVLYVTYDVTAYLKEGENVIGIMLGNGWYWNPGVIMPGVVFKSSGQPELIFQMYIKCQDGTAILALSGMDQDWLSAAGPIICNSIYDGETYDARLEKTGWDQPGYIVCENEWTPVENAEKPKGKMVSQHLEPICVIGEITPISMTNPVSGILVFDMGKNIAGWVRIKTEGHEGMVMRIRYAEVLYDDGTINQENLRGAKSTDTYVLKGNGMEVYEPRFTYHGFRYVQLEGYPELPDISCVTGRLVRSSVRSAGSFLCSEDLLNEIQENAVRTEANNLHSIPTDCPQRDERLGWLNDATVRAEEAIYNFDMSRFYAKWMDDISDTQDEITGAITNTAPDVMPLIPGVWEHTHADAVCSSYLIIPWLLYKHYGDIKILERHYEGMKHWTEFIGKKAERFIVTFSQMGDWASPVDQCLKDSVGSGAVSAYTPGTLMSTGFYYYNANLISKMARILKRKRDADRFLRLANRIKKAFNHEFLDINKCSYASGSQASNVLPVYLDIVPEYCRNAVIENIVEDIFRNKGHLTTGNICSKYILEVLSDSGNEDVAYALASCDTYPSWGYMIKEGATTIWERWEKNTGGGMNSHDHPMYGSISTWFFRYLGGIQTDEDGPGFEKIIIKPVVPEGLEYCNVTLLTVRGEVISSWKKQGVSLQLNVRIPFNCSSRIFLPKKNAGVGGAVTENGRIILEDNRFVLMDEGLKSGIETKEFFLFETGSGEYCFKYNLN